MTKQQKQITWAMNIYVSSILMYYITQNVKAYIGLSYPEVSDVTVTSLITIPTMFALVFSFIIGPLAMRFNKVALMTIVMCCMGAYSLIFFFNGLMHGPFFLYTVACALAGFAQGGFAITYFPTIVWPSAGAAVLMGAVCYGAFLAIPAVINCGGRALWRYSLSKS